MEAGARDPPLRGEPPLARCCCSRGVYIGLAVVVVAAGGGGVGYYVVQHTHGAAPGTTTTTTTTSTVYPEYSCQAPYVVSQPAKMEHKGLCLDDTTFWHCSDKVPGLWPNTDGERVGSLRLFSTWKSSWGGDAERYAAWHNLIRWVKTNNAKLLMGTGVTCDAAADDAMWAWDLELIQMLGKEHVLGIAVGNEMDIYNEKGTPPECIAELWNGRYWATLQSRVADLDKLGMQDMKVTIVWAMSVLGAAPGKTWKEDSAAKVDTLVTQAAKKWPDRWVWSFNVYSIWDRNLWPTGPDNCDAKTAASISIEYTKNILKVCRQKINATTGNASSPMWVGENGWSSPMPGGHQLFPYCPQYDSLDTFRKAFEAFMTWDLSIADDLVGPEHAFYFTMRDSNNGAAQEGFGLIKSCNDTDCKINSTGLVQVVV